jgi:hypothetical protein
MILNTSIIHQCTTRFVDELLSLLHNSILLKPNNLGKSHYEAKSLIWNLGVGYTSIHSCENGCIMFHREHNTTKNCPICGLFLFVLGQNQVPNKMFRHFPFILRLKQMFKTPNPSKLMKWHPLLKILGFAIVICN